MPSPNTVFQNWVPAPASLPAFSGISVPPIRTLVWRWRNWLYVAGGVGLVSGFSNDIWRIRFDASGVLQGPWQFAGSLPLNLSSAGVVVRDNEDWIFIVGGVDNLANVTLNSVYRGKFSMDGSVGNWTLQTPLPVQLYNEEYATVWANNDYIYTCGLVGPSGTVPNGLYYARVLPDRSIGQWQFGTLPFLDANQVWAGLVEHNGFLFVAGGGPVVAGTPSQNIVSAKLFSDGSWAPAVFVGSLSTPRWRCGLVKAQGAIWFVGGSSGTSSATVQASTECFRIETDGQTLGPSIPGPVLPTAGRNFRLVDLRGVLHALSYSNASTSFADIQALNIKY